jgi:hypothetical protein
MKDLLSSIIAGVLGGLLSLTLGSGMAWLTVFLLKGVKTMLGY